MSEKEKTILIVVIALLFLFSCFLISCCAGSMLLLSRMDRNSIIELLNESSLSSQFNIEDEPVEITVSESDLKERDENGLSMAEKLVIEATEKTRGLSSKTKFAPVYQTVDELRDYMTAQLDDVTDDELKDELGLYNILGFAPKDFDLRQFYVDLYTEQIAGFFDPEENKMYLIEGDTPYNNAVTLAHEYTHFLQYNTPDFKKNLDYDDDFCETNGETCMIIDALIEGDATLTEGLVNVDSIIGKYKDNSGTIAQDSSIFDNAPKFFQDSLLFPYVYGYDFVSYHYLEGGFDKVNDLYINLPQSVEQILHPEKYLKDEPINVAMEPFRSMITKEFEIINEDVLNESDILMILTDGYEKDWQLSDRQAAVSAEGWGGGGFIFAEDDDKPLFFAKIVWDSVDDAKEAETAFTLYSDKRFGKQTGELVWSGEDGAAVHLIRQDDVLYWMILPESFVAEDFLKLINTGSAL